jgi:hypothetical protein
MRANRSGRWRWGRRAAVLLLLLAASGCGRTASVTGTVTFKGEPVTSGAVTFYGPGGRVDSSQIDENGKYAVAKAPVGEVKVTVVSAAPRRGGDVPKGKEVPEHPGRSKSSPPKAGKAVPIPGKYKDPESSGLSYTLKAGSQVINIDLKP